jgi:hypothetical protein
MGNPQKSRWQVFIDECRQCLVDYFSPFVLLARWLRRRTRKKTSTPHAKRHQMGFVTLNSGSYKSL